MFYLDKKKKKLQYTFGEDLASSTCLVFQMAEAVPAVFPCPAVSWQYWGLYVHDKCSSVQPLLPGGHRECSWWHQASCMLKTAIAEAQEGMCCQIFFLFHAMNKMPAAEIKLILLWVRTGCALPLVMFFLQGTQVWHQILRHLVSSHTCTRHWCPTEHTKHFIRISRIPLNFFISHGNAIISSSSMRKWKVSRKLAFQCAKMHREGECLLIVPSQCCPTHPWHLCQ